MICSLTYSKLVLPILLLGVSWLMVYQAPKPAFSFICFSFVNMLVVFTARCTLVQSAVLRSHVVCLSVCLSVRLSVCL